jgi:hypothetical protein
MEKKPAPTIRDLYPDFTDEQLAEAEDAHDRYLAIVLRIFERMESEAPPHFSTGVYTSRICHLPWNCAKTRRGLVGMG